MVVVMAPSASDKEIADVVARVESAGGEAFVSRGVARTIIGLVGDLEQFHNEAGIKAAGKLRMEGKEYVVHDGDIMHFLFNV